MDHEPLRRLVALSHRFEELVTTARNYMKSALTPRHDTGVVLRLSDVDRALEMYLDGALTDRQLTEWADLLEVNELLQYEVGLEEVISDTLFRLSTPEINEPIGVETVRQLRTSLSQRLRP